MKEKREKLAHLAYMVSNVEVGVHVLRHIAFLVSDEAAVFHRTFKEIPWKVGQAFSYACVPKN